MKLILAVLSLVVIAASATAATAKAACPTDAMREFDGTFKGVLAPLDLQGQAQPLQNVTEIHTVTGCTSLDFDVHYFNPETGLETREVKFSADWDESKVAF